MKKENLSDAFETLDEDIIASVYKARTESVKKNPRRYLRYIAIAACFCIIITSVFVGVMNRNIVHAQDLMEGISPNPVEPIALDAYNEKVTDFAIRLFKASQNDGQNSLISPLSVMCALSMTLNGADGETKAQMEAVLGMSGEELNNYIYSYINSLPIKNKYKLTVANSIWLDEDGGFVPNSDFLQTNADYYGADIYKTQFDSKIVNQINDWISRETEGMIPRMLDHIPQETMVLLINSIAFRADWSDIYVENEIHDGVFTLENGTEKEVKLMYDNDLRTYFGSDNCIGFVKNYVGNKYAFAAILPDEGIAMSDFLETLTGEKISEMLANQQKGKVRTRIPKFKTEFNVDLENALVEMGMTDAFSQSNADFGLMGSSPDNFFIDSVLHKTFIEVNERGTRAGAATFIPTLGIDNVNPDDVKIYLDRPFVYMLIDLETNTPFFIGTMMNPEI